MHEVVRETVRGARGLLMAGETTPTPGDYSLLTLVLPLQATKSVWRTSPSLVLCVWLPEPGTQSALIPVTLHRRQPTLENWSTEPTNIHS